MTDTITIPEAARLAAASQMAIRRAIRAGKLTATKLGGVYLLDRAETLAYIAYVHDTNGGAWRRGGHPFKETKL